MARAKKQTLQQDSFFQQEVWTNHSKQYPKKYYFEYWKTMFEYTFNRIRDSQRPLGWTHRIMFKLYMVAQEQYSRKGFLSKAWIKAVAVKAVEATIYDNLPPPPIPKEVVEPENEIQVELRMMKEEMRKRGSEIG